jgi:hypothetical protein
METSDIVFIILFLGIPVLLFLFALVIIIINAGSILDETGHMVTNVAKKVDKFLSE